MKTTSSHAHYTAKPLLHTNIKQCDEWYAVTKKWYTHFEHFAYFDAEYDENEADYYTKFENREFPPSLNDSELRDTNNTFQLKRELNENEHFVWIQKDLYHLFIEWFGIEDGSLSFKREVVNISINEIKTELIIEMYPLFICYVLCGNDGEADVTTKRIIPISYHHNLNEFITKIIDISLSLDDDDKSVRIWRKQHITEEKEEEWDPFPDNEGEPPLYQQIEDNWRLIAHNEYNIVFGEWALNVDLSSNISYMIEVKNDDGNWKRNDWRELLSVGTKIDIYDSAYSKWYTGAVVTIDECDNNKITVHYDGYSSCYDESMSRYSDRIDVLNKHSSVDPFWSNYCSSSYNNHDTTPPLHNGCVGLRNLGNTCFMNSTIQCLSHCPLFVEYFLDRSRWFNDVNRDNPLGWKGKVAETWSQLLSNYWCSKYSVLSPNDLKKTIAEIQPRFSGYQQHDSSELLQFLLDGLHEDLNRIKEKPNTLQIESNDSDNECEIAVSSWNTHKMRNDSIVVDLIQGQLKSRVECPDCNRISVTFDPFMFLSVPIPREKKYVIKQITVIHLDLNILPRKYAIKLPRLSSISDLINELVIITKIPKNRLIIADVWTHHLYNIYKKYVSIDEISDNDHTICYEVPTDEEMKYLMDISIDIDIKFKIIPIYHQIIKESTYFNANHVTNHDLGVPLLLKLPLQYDIETVFITEYITKIIEPYFENMDKWDPSIKPLESDEEDEPPIQLMFDSSSSNEGVVVVADAADDDDDEDVTIPYTFVVLDKYGKSCGKCGYSAYCNGCNLNTLKDSLLSISDSEYESISIGIRWKIGAQSCFNHNAFISPLYDKSVSQLKSVIIGSYSKQKTVDLSQCIDEFVAEETLSKNDAWYCGVCKEHKEAKKKLDLYSLPTICIIHLKRFAINGYFREKNDCAVKYPIHGLNLSQWIQNTKSDSIYDLFAVSIHSGSLGGGHYIAYAKNRDNGEWFEFDDSCVSAINENDVYTNSAYVLFYNKRDIIK